MKRKWRLFIGVFLCMTMMLSVFPEHVRAAQTITSNETGSQGGYDYELWKDNGTTSMTLNDGGAFSCSWSNINNALFRKGKKYNETQTHQQLGDIKMKYACDYQPNGNSYLSVYGWTSDPLVEYYIIESWGTWRPPGSNSPKRTITVDGGTYDIYETTRVNQPSIKGTATFQQYWSVRTSKRTSGTISVSEHFKAWESLGMEMGKMYEVSLVVEGYQSSGKADVTSMSIEIGDEEEEEEEEQGYYGDVNSDGAVDAIDFASIKAYILGQGTLKNKVVADINVDGSVDSLDLAKLNKMLLENQKPEPINTSEPQEVNANPTWNADEPVIFHGEAKPYDYYGAKDPTIVYYGGKYHVFYTGANQSGGWQMLYTSASNISGLKTAPRTFMSTIQESYFCAPQVFYFEPKGLWYLVYQDGTYGAAYSTTTNIGDPTSWSKPKSLGLSGNMGWDYYIVCDDNNAYIYNTPDDGSGKLYMRRTTLANFPTGWSSPSVAISNSFEGAHVYKSLADGKYYMIIEDMKDGRYYELWTSSSAGGPWNQVAEKWSWRGNLTYNGNKWTTNVSHGEIIRAGYNQKMEIKDINKVDFLIQGTTSLSGDYQKIIWDLGLIRNY